MTCQKTLYFQCFYLPTCNVQSPAVYADKPPKLEWHSRGQEFDPPRLHQVNTTAARVCRTQRLRLFCITDKFWRTFGAQCPENTPMRRTWSGGQRVTVEASRLRGGTTHSPAGALSASGRPRIHPRRDRALWCPYGREMARAGFWVDIEMCGGIIRTCCFCSWRGTRRGAAGHGPAWRGAAWYGTAGRGMDGVGASRTVTGKLETVSPSSFFLRLRNVYIVI